MRQRFARDHAPDFNMVTFFQPNENHLTAVFAWLLDIRESHGQGDVFLKLFLAAFVREPAGQPPADWSSAIVRREAPTAAGGRIDLLLTNADDQTAVVIENKPWANWQDRQLRRYLEDQTWPGRSVTVLALVGYTAEAADAQGHVDKHWGADPCPPNVVGASYVDVIRWLTACADAARPERVRRFVADLAGFCSSISTGGSDDMTENAELSETILSEGPEAMRSAFAIEGAMEAVRGAFTKRVADDVRRLLPSSSNWKVEVSNGAEVGWKYSILISRAGAPAPLIVCLFETPDGRSSWVGFTEDAKPHVSRLIERGWKQQRYWSAWRHASELGEPWARKLDTGLQAKQVGDVANAACAAACALLGAELGSPVAA